MFQSFGDLHFDPSSDVLYMQTPATRMTIDHEMGQRHQKNWSPFQFQMPRLGELENLFIYSVHPHRVVLVNETVEVGVKKVHTLSVTEFQRKDEGGSITIYITIYDQAYLHMHHTHIYIHICIVHIHTYKKTYIHTYIYIHTNIHTNIHIYIQTYIQTYIQHIHAYIRTYMHTYIHTYKHTSIHT